MQKLILNCRDKVLGILANRIDDFYLAGGTALSLAYFHHRESFDLDFFTQKFQLRRIEEIVSVLEEQLERKIKLTAQQVKDTARAKMCIYHVPVGREKVLKIDFVEDYIKLIKPFTSLNGVKVLSLEDIYLRKIYAVAGTVQSEDATGRIISTGREEAKDFYDLYFLSHTFMSLAEFAMEYCNMAQIEGLIHWFRTFDRLKMKSDCLDIVSIPKKEVDYGTMEKHLAREIQRIVEKEIGFI